MKIVTEIFGNHKKMLYLCIGKILEMNIKGFLKDKGVELTSLGSTLFKACKNYFVDGILVILGLAGLVYGLVVDNLFAAFVSTVLAMHSLYTAFRLDSLKLK